MLPVQQFRPLTVAEYQDRQQHKVWQRPGGVSVEETWFCEVPATEPFGDEPERHPLLVAREAMRKWDEAESRLANKYIRSLEEESLLGQIAGSAAVLAAVALRASELAESGRYTILTEEE